MFWGKKSYQISVMNSGATFFDNDDFLHNDTRSRPKELMRK